MAPGLIPAVVVCLCAMVVANTVANSGCLSVPYVIYARGTDPVGGTSSTAPDADFTDAALENIASTAIPDASVAALQYPASGIVSGTDYFTSWGVGIDNLQKMIEFYVDACPGVKIVLLGYSQGASVITGSLGGGQGRPVLASKYLNAIAGGVAIADPSFVPNLSPLNELSTNTNAAGTYQDGNVQVFVNDNVGAVFRSLCNAGDEFCANAGPSGASIHDNAQGNWTGTAISFLQSLALQ